MKVPFSSSQSVPSPRTVTVRYNGMKHQLLFSATDDTSATLKTKICRLLRFGDQSEFSFILESTGQVLGDRDLEDLVR